MNLFSGIFTINWKDVIKSTIVAGTTILLATLLQIIEGGSFPTVPQLVAALKVAGLAAAAYLLKQLTTNNEGEFLKKDV